MSTQRNYVLYRYSVERTLSTIRVSTDYIHLAHPSVYTQDVTWTLAINADK